MKSDDVEDKTNSNSEGGVHIFNEIPRTKAGNTMDVSKNDNVKVHMLNNVRVRKMDPLAGWSEKRGIAGKYLLPSVVSVLVLCLITAKPVLVSKEMLTQADIENSLNKVLDIKLVTISADINQVKTQLSDDLSHLKIDQDKKIEELDKKWENRFVEMEENQRRLQELSISASGGGRIGSVTLVDPKNNKPAKTGSSKPAVQDDVQRTTGRVEVSIPTGQMSMAEQIIAAQQSQERPSREELQRIWEEEDRKRTSQRGYRYRHQDYSAKMCATPDQIAKFDKDWKTGSEIIGVYPIEESDKIQAKEDLKKEGRPEDSITQVDIDCKAIRSFLELDMGMTPDIVDELLGQVERYFYENKTAFIKFKDRGGVLQVYHYAPLMNKMAARKHCIRKLHLWISPQMELRFWALKNIEYQFRTLKRSKGKVCHTHIFYRDQTIYAQWRNRDDKEYEDIPEHPSMKIPGVEYWRQTPHPRLNNRGTGAPIHKPPLGAATPRGRQRVESSRGRGRGSGNASKNLFGESQRGRGAGFSRGGTRGTRGRRGRGGRGGNSQPSQGQGQQSSGLPELPAPGQGSQPQEATGGATGGLPALPAPEGMEGVQDFPHNEEQLKDMEEHQKRLQVQIPGNARAVSFVSGEENSGQKAGKKRGRKPRHDSATTSSQSKKIDDFFTPKSSKSKPAKRGRGYDSSDEEMADGENKSARLTNSPTEDELALYRKVATSLHKEGILKPAVAVQISNEHKDLMKTLKQEEKYLKDIKKGKTSPSKEEVAMMSQVFKTKRWRSKSRLENLFRLNQDLSDQADTEAKAVDYVSPNATFNSSLGSLPDAYADVFATEDED